MLAAFIGNQSQMPIKLRNDMFINEATEDCIVVDDEWDMLDT